MVKAVLSESEQTQIERAVRMAEARTSAEIAVCVLRAAGEDRGIAAIVSALVLALAMGGLTALMPEIDPLVSLGIAVALALAGFVVCDLWDLGLRLLPAGSLVKDARRAARDVFLDHGLDAMPGRNAVLLFISRAERYVEILPDRALAAQVAPERWAEIVAEFRATARRGGLAEAAAGAVARIGALAAVPFPATADNPDRAANRPITE
jgi:putative membrane protein